MESSKCGQGNAYIDSITLQGSELTHHGTAILQGADALQRRQERAHASALNLYGIHTRSIERAHATHRRISPRAHLPARFLQDLMKHGVRTVLDQLPDAVIGELGGNRRARQPPTIHVAVEIGARRAGGVEVGTGNADRRGRHAVLRRESSHDDYEQSRYEPHRAHRDSFFAFLKLRWNLITTPSPGPPARFR